MDVQLSNDTVVTIECIKRNGKSVCKLTFRDRFDPFMVWVKRSDVVQVYHLLSKVDSRGQKGFWPDRLIYFGISDGRIRLTRRERRYIEREYPVTTAQAQAMVAAIREVMD